MRKRRLGSWGWALVASMVAGCPNPGTPAPTSSPASAGNAMARPEAATGASKSGASDSAGGPLANNAGGLISNNAGPVPVPAPSAAGVGGVPGDQAPIEPLKAGAVDDNADFAGYLKYRSRYDGAPMRAYDVEGRQLLRVLDAEGRGVSNAEVRIAVGDKVLATGKTYANGQWLFHPRAFSEAVQASQFQVTVQKGDATVTQALAPSPDSPWSLRLASSVPKPAPQLEVLFLLDATGSMGGEIRRLQTTLDAIAGRLKGLPQQPSIRFALVPYRDREDDYVTQLTDFTADLPAFQTALNGVAAGGGGDVPEDLEAGLSAAVGKASWNTGEALRFVFVVTDAAPHVDYADSTPYTQTMQQAASAGIKLFTIGASGLTREGEYALRQIAQGTLGQYLFITRGGDEHSGGGEVSHTVDQFSEGRLDDIVVKLVTKELESLGQ